MPVVMDDAAAIHYRSAMFVLIRIVAVDCTIRRRVRDEFAIGYDHVSLICDYTVIGAAVGPEYAIGDQGTVCASNRRTVRTFPGLDMVVEKTASRQVDRAVRPALDHSRESATMEIGVVVGERASYETRA